MTSFAVDYKSEQLNRCGREARPSGIADTLEYLHVSLFHYEAIEDGHKYLIKHEQEEKYMLDFS